MKYKTQLQVRSYECDSYSHVNNAVYLNYLETARMDYLNQIQFPYKEAVAQGYYLYISHIDIYYKSSAYLNDILTIETEPVKMGAVKGTIHQEIKNEQGTICAVADVTWATVKNGIPAKLPQEFIVPGLQPDQQ